MHVMDAREHSCMHHCTAKSGAKLSRMNGAGERPGRRWGQGVHLRAAAQCNWPQRLQRAAVVQALRCAPAAWLRLRLLHGRDLRAAGNACQCRRTAAGGRARAGIPAGRLRGGRAQLARWCCLPPAAHLQVSHCHLSPADYSGLFTLTLHVVSSSEKS